MRKIVGLALALVSIVVVNQRAVLAWHGKGHMAVAYVAYQLLDAPIKARVKTLLRKNPAFDQWQQRLQTIPANEKEQMYFVVAALWSDDIKRDSAYTSDGSSPTGPDAARNTGYADKLMHKYWHYVDHPFTNDGTPLPAIPSVNAEERIKLFRDTLASNASDTKKSYDLVWLEHLVGDVHQPLHTAARVSAAKPKGDAGGNDVKLASACSACNGEDELHGLWDGVVGETKKSVVAAAYAKTLPPAAPAAVSVTDVGQWIAESFSLAKANVYIAPVGPGLGPFTLTSGYRSDARDLADKQVALAGARLAKLINEHLK